MAMARVINLIGAASRTSRDVRRCARMLLTRCAHSSPLIARFCLCQLAFRRDLLRPEASRRLLGIAQLGLWQKRSNVVKSKA